MHSHDPDDRLHHSVGQYLDDDAQWTHNASGIDDGFYHPDNSAVHCNCELIDEPAGSDLAGSANGEDVPAWPHEADGEWLIASSDLPAAWHAFMKADFHDTDSLHSNYSTSHSQPLDSESFDATAAQLTEMGMPTHANLDASPIDVMVELLQGRQVLMSTDGHESWAESHHFDGLPTSLEGKPIFLREIQVTDTSGLQLIIADSSDPHGEAVAIPFDAFVHAEKGPRYSYLASDEPPRHLGDIAHGFDTEKGFFEDAVEWLANNAPKFVSTVVSVIVGEEVGHLLDSEGAKYVSHFVTEKVIDSVVAGGSEKDLSTSENRGIPMSENEMLEMMKRI